MSELLLLGGAGLMPLPDMSMQRAGDDFLPFVRAGSAVLMRSFILLGTKTLATAVSARYIPSSPIHTHNWGHSQ